MDTSFWHDKWAKNEIAFHGSEANPLLVKYWHQMDAAPGACVFIPLCGKTLDIAWLLEKGYRVAGAELVDDAVQQLFAELGVQPQVSENGGLKHYCAANLDIFSGDIFDLTPESLGPVDVIYDRAALVALPADMRVRYTKHLRALTNAAAQLVICYEYDQSKMDGPPFSISPAELQKHYADYYRIEKMESVEVPGGVKGLCAAHEHVWHLRKK